MRRYRGVNMTYKGQSAEWTRVESGPLPEFAPEELKELEAMLPAPSAIEDGAGLTPSEAAAFFADLETEHEDVDVSGFVGITFDPDADVTPVPAPVVASISLDAPLAELDLNVRIEKNLAAAGVMTVGELADKTEDELGALEGIGPKAVAEIRDRLEQLGLVVG
jgi:DNA-directed RNA polymerase alpha subunit